GLHPGDLLLRGVELVLEISELFWRIAELRLNGLPLIGDARFIANTVGGHLLTVSPKIELALLLRQTSIALDRRDVAPKPAHVLAMRGEHFRIGVRLHHPRFIVPRVVEIRRELVVRIAPSVLRLRRERAILVLERVVRLSLRSDCRLDA